jgi:hypothetical protein
MKQPRQKIDGNFTPMLHGTMDTPAWRALSHGAKVLYLALKRRSNQTLDNNGRVYLAQRTAKRELGSGREQIARWFRELEHFGLIVMVAPGNLGVNGKGRAPRWRLTELPYGGEPPTRDFARWDGAPYRAPKNRIPAPKPGPLRPRFRGQRSGPETRATPRSAFGPETRAKGAAPKPGPNLESALHLIEPATGDGPARAS